MGWILNSFFPVLSDKEYSKAEMGLHLSNTRLILQQISCYVWNTRKMPALGVLAPGRDLDWDNLQGDTAVVIGDGKSWVEGRKKWKHTGSVWEF